MRGDRPAVLIVATDHTSNAIRLALRFFKYGGEVSAICSPLCDLRRWDGIAHWYPLRVWDVWQSLHAAIVQSRVEYLVPYDDLAYCMLHGLILHYPCHAELVERSLGVSSSSKTIFSRVQLLNLAAQLGIKTPEVKLAQCPDNVRAWMQDRGAPLVLKRDFSWGGSGVEVVNENTNISECFARLGERNSLAFKLQHLLLDLDPAPFIESLLFPKTEISAHEFVEGVPANALFACRKGRILGSVHARVLVAGGKTRPAAVMELIHNERIERAGRLLADSLQLSGFFGLDFILSDSADEPYLIELNPRCTKLAYLQVANRTDLAGILWAAWTGNALPGKGDPSLGNVFCVYPWALKLGLDNRLLGQARFDVSAEDIEVVDQLMGNRRPGLISRILMRFRVGRILRFMGISRRSRDVQAEQQLVYFKRYSI